MEAQNRPSRSCALPWNASHNGQTCICACDAASSEGVLTVVRASVMIDQKLATRPCVLSMPWTRPQTLTPATPPASATMRMVMKMLNPRLQGSREPEGLVVLFTQEGASRRKI